MLISRAVRPVALLVVSWATFWVAFPALGQTEEIFGSGKAPVFREEKLDRRFSKSQLAKLLSTGTTHPGCVQLLSGLFVALGEIAPTLHKRDDTFVLDPALQAAVNQQLSTANFPAMAYLVSMVRHMMIARHLPEPWLKTAADLNRTAKIIDVAKLKMVSESISLADSALFTLPLLRQRYVLEVLGSNSAVTTDVVQTFRDAWLDRDVAWGGATLIDVGVNQPKGKRVKKFRSAEAEEFVAVLQYLPPDPRKQTLDLLSRETQKVEPMRIYARLQARQFADVEKLVRGQRVLVKGRFWEMNREATEVEVRDALLFNDIDWSRGVVLADPAQVATCPAAINELMGLAPNQPGGFAH